MWGPSPMHRAFIHVSECESVCSLYGMWNFLNITTTFGDKNCLENGFECVTRVLYTTLKLPIQTVTHQENDCTKSKIPCKQTW